MKSTKSYEKYIKLYGPHFTKELCTFAVGLMERDNKPIDPFDKLTVDEKLKRQNITLQYNKLHDAVYVANMCKADFLGESVPNDDWHLCMYIKNVIDDPDGYDGQIFNRWVSDMEGMGISVDWSEYV